jgi:hypothetical protein
MATTLPCPFHLDPHVVPDLPEGVRLVCTGCMCPEQYDVYFDDTRIGYLKLRYGVFTAKYPNACGEVVYRCTFLYDEYKGAFTREERAYSIPRAVETLIRRAIAEKTEGRYGDT